MRLEGKGEKEKTRQQGKIESTTTSNNMASPSLSRGLGDVFESAVFDPAHVVCPSGGVVECGHTPLSTRRGRKAGTRLPKHWLQALRDVLNAREGNPNLDDGERAEFGWRYDLKGERGGNGVPFCVKGARAWCVDLGGLEVLVLEVDGDRSRVQVYEAWRNNAKQYFTSVPKPGGGGGSMNRM